MKNKSTVEQYKGLSFADASMKIKKKYSESDNDPIQKASLENELNQLIQHQEKKKTIDTMTKALKEFKCGGKLPKHEYGGEIDPLATLTPRVMPGLLGQLPLLNSSVVVGQMPVLGQRGVNPISNTPITTPQVNTMPYKVTVNESNVSTQPRNTGEMSAYTPALLGQGLSTLINAGILAGGYDKVAPVENPYESDVKGLMAGRGIDTTQQTNSILSAYNAARTNLSNVRSANVRNALDTNLSNITQDSLAESNLNQQQINNGYTADLASTLNNLGQQKVQSRTLAEENTARNKGQFQSNVSALGKNIADNSQFFTSMKLNEVQNKLLGDILSSKYADVGLNPDVATRIGQGKLTPDDITTLKAKLPQSAVEGIIKSYNETYGTNY